MIFCFDLDGTLCTNTNGDYKKAQPILDRIKKLNYLYDSGNTIKIDTARGKTTGIDWTEVTKNQLNEWGVKYHELRVGIKMNADYFIDDKCITDINFFDEKINWPNKNEI